MVNDPAFDDIVSIHAPVRVRQIVPDKLSKGGKFQSTHP